MTDENTQIIAIAMDAVHVTVNYMRQTLTLDFMDVSIGKLTDVHNLYAPTAVNKCYDWSLARVGAIRALEHQFVQDNKIAGSVGMDDDCKIVMYLNGLVDSGICCLMVRKYFEQNANLTCTLQNDFS